MRILVLTKVDEGLLLQRREKNAYKTTNQQSSRFQLLASVFLIPESLSTVYEEVPFQ